MKYTITIIGGGPSGMMAAYSAIQTNKNNKILLIEKNKELGKKLLLTGGGRCNITNQLPIKDQIKLYENKSFIKHSLHKLNNNKLLEIFEKEKINFKTEDNGRIFPTTDKSQTIKNTLEKLIQDKIEIKTNTTVTEIKHHQNHFEIKTKNETIESKKVILTTGGITYPKTGSTGDGYKLSKNLKHHLSPIKPGLVSLIIEDSKLNSISGTNLDNIKIHYKVDKKVKYWETGSLLITHKGLSGPAIINLSNKILKHQKYDLLNNDNDFTPVNINLDLIPKLSQEELRNKINNDTIEYGKTKVKNYLKHYMANRFIEYFLNKTSIDSNTPMNQLKKKDKNKLIEHLKRLEFTVNDIVLDDAKITIGGVSCEDINSKTLESKIVDGLFFAGEILEFAGPTGGFNLQLAFSTGYLAGYSASL